MHARAPCTRVRGHARGRARRARARGNSNAHPTSQFNARQPTSRSPGPCSFTPQRSFVHKPHKHTHKHGRQGPSEEARGEEAGGEEARGEEARGEEAGGEEDDGDEEEAGGEEAGGEEEACGCVNSMRARARA